MNTQELSREEIARLAYQLWEERGCPMGSPELDWERAEKALRYDASSDTGAEAPIDGEETASVERMDVSAGSERAPVKANAAAPKSPRRPSRANGRSNDGPRRSTQAR